MGDGRNNNIICVCVLKFILIYALTIDVGIAKVGGETDERFFRCSMKEKMNSFTLPFEMTETNK